MGLVDQPRHSPVLNVDSAALIRMGDVEFAKLGVMRTLADIHRRYAITLPSPPVGYYWKYEIQTEYILERDTWRARVEYTLAELGHEEWCHTMVGCSEPGHCTCGAAGRALLQLHQRAPLAIEGHQW